MQYFKPAEDQFNLFVGDCMPFFHEGIFHLFYLLDEGHHQALGGLGGHQWAQATSPDLITWQHHPLAIALTEDWEGSICTGSTFWWAGTYYAFYATRRREHTIEKKHHRKQHLSLATSSDGLHFTKVEPNPLASPPDGYSPYHYRDPFVFHDPEAGRFHMLVTAELEDYPVRGRGGCLAQLVSKDLKNWTVKDPFLIPGLPGTPECPDYFFWQGWYYLLFSSGLVTHYRLSRHPFGPWERPRVDTLAGPWARVMKTAPFKDDRRIGVAWLGSRADDKENGTFLWAGNALFRELIQQPDGTLGTKFPAEMIPASHDPLMDLAFTPLTPGTSGAAGRIELAAQEGLGVACLTGLPRNIRLTMHIKPEVGAADYGLRLRAQEPFDSGHDLNFWPDEGLVKFRDQMSFGLAGLDRPFSLDIVLQEDIIDICIAGRRTLVDRCPEQFGEYLYFYSQNGSVLFDDIAVRPLMSEERKNDHQ